MERKINVLFSSLSGELIGGGQQSLLLLLKKIDKNKISPFLVCPSFGDLTNIARTLEIKTFIIPMPKIKKIKVKSIIEIIKIIKNNNINIIHSDSPRQAFYCGIAAKLCKKPFIFHVRTSMRQNIFFDYFLYLISRKVIVVCNAAKKRFKWFINKKEKIEVIYNGVDLLEFESKTEKKFLEKEFNIHENFKVIATAGQIIPSKGQEIFIKSAEKIIKEIDIPVNFMIIGSGDIKYLNKLKQLTKELKIENNIIFTGFRNDIIRIIKVIDIFVLLSFLQEGISRVILDAMAAGKPVIATNVGGNCEIIENNITGILLSKNNLVENLTNSIVKMLLNPTIAKKMGENGKNRVKLLFDINDKVKRIENIYEELICQKR
jgi:glycosyltransferase involved in cell wall biosynthesis